MMKRSEIVKIVGASALLFGAFCAEAMPTRAQLKKVQGAVNELMAEDVESMKSGKMKPADVARNAEKFASMATDEASKFLFYKGAFGLYVQGGAYDEAVRAMEKLTSEVKDVPDAVQMDIVRGKLKKISRKNGGAIFDLYSRLDRRTRLTSEIAGLEKKLKGAPTDKALLRRLAVARVQLGPWSAAAKDLAALGAKEKDAVENEVKNPAAAADFWWTYAADEDDQETFREHAAELYRKAIASGSLDGIKLALAKKRAAEIEPAVATSSEKSVKQPVVAGEEPAIAASAAKPIAWDEKHPKPIVIPLKGKDVRPLEFMPIPAGRVKNQIKEDVGKQYKNLVLFTTATISRPFWMAKLVIDHAQWESVMGTKHGVWSRWTKESDEKGGKMRVTSLALGGGDENRLSVVCYSPQAHEFIDKLNQDYARYLPQGMVFRLPSLVEFEHASACGRQKKWDWITSEYIAPRDYYALLLKARVELPKDGVMELRRSGRCDSLNRLGWLSAYLCGFLPTGVKKPNPYGLYDMGFRTFVLDRCSESAELKKPNDDAVDLVFGVDDYSAPHLWCGDYNKVCRSFMGLTLCLRVVIGPDLVGEWDARQKK